MKFYKSSPVLFYGAGFESIKLIRDILESNPCICLQLLAKENPYEKQRVSLADLRVKVIRDYILESPRVESEQVKAFAIYNENENALAKYPKDTAYVEAIFVDTQRERGSQQNELSPKVISSIYGYVPEKQKIKEGKAGVLDSIRIEKNKRRYFKIDSVMKNIEKRKTEAFRNSLKVYPSPFKDCVFLENSNPELNLFVQLYDSKGILIEDWAIDTNKVVFYPKSGDSKEFLLRVVNSQTGQSVAYTLQKE